MIDQTKNIIAIDIDSTLHEYMHTVALVALNEFGVRMEGSPEEWSAVFPKEFHPSRYKDIFMRCHDREFIFLTKPYPGAVDSVKELHDMG